MTETSNGTSDLKIAIVVDPAIATGAIANRCAVLATGLAAHRPEIIGGDLGTADGRNLLGFTQVPISVLRHAASRSCATWKCERGNSTARRLCS